MGYDGNTVSKFNIAESWVSIKLFWFKLYSFYHPAGKFEVSQFIEHTKLFKKVNDSNKSSKVLSTKYLCQEI